MPAVSSWALDSYLQGHDLFNKISFLLLLPHGTFLFCIWFCFVYGYLFVLFMVISFCKVFVFVSMKFEITRKLMTFRCLGNRIISIKIDAPDNFFITRKNVWYFLIFFLNWIKIEKKLGYFVSSIIPRIDQLDLIIFCK